MDALKLGNITQGGFPHGKSTWANRPAASAYNGKGWYMTDLKHVFISDGTDWFPMGGVMRGGGTAVAVSHTGNGNRTSVWSATIPGGLLGANGQLWIYPQFTLTNSGNSKNPRIRLGSTDFWSPGATSTYSAHGFVVIANRNNAAVQFSSPNTTLMFSNTAATGVSGTENTANDLTLDFSFQLANTGETGTLERIHWELRK